MQSFNTEKPQTKKQPPNLIFGETHDDPAVKIILLKMLNELQKLGYTSFYDEIPEHKNVDMVIEEMEMLKIWYLNLIETSKALNKGQIPTYEELKIIHKDCPDKMQIIKALPGYLENLSLMQKLKKSNIDYIPIDINSDDHNYKISKTGGDERDEHMAGKYLSADNPVFGLVGVHHLKGIKEHLKESNNFEYIFIYSSSYTGLTGSDLEWYKKWKIKDIPEGVHILDLDEMGDDKIVEIMLNIIKNHDPEINDLKNLAMRIKESPSNVQNRTALYNKIYQVFEKIINLNMKQQTEDVLGKWKLDNLECLYQAGLLNVENIGLVWESSSNPDVSKVFAFLKKYQAFTPNNITSLLKVSLGHWYLLENILVILESNNLLSQNLLNKLCDGVNFEKLDMTYVNLNKEEKEKERKKEERQRSLDQVKSEAAQLGIFSEGFVIPKKRIFYENVMDELSNGIKDLNEHIQIKELQILINSLTTIRKSRHTPPYQLALMIANSMDVINYVNKSDLGVHIDLESFINPIINKSGIKKEKIIGLLDEIKSLNEQISNKYLR